MIRGMNFAPQPKENEHKIPTVIFVIGANGRGEISKIFVNNFDLTLI